VVTWVNGPLWITLEWRESRSGAETESDDVSAPTEREPVARKL
jgi:hypothetical protein